MFILFIISPQNTRDILNSIFGVMRAARSGTVSTLKNKYELSFEEGIVII